jgi:anti-anti-sigma factor
MGISFNIHASMPRRHFAGGWTLKLDPKDVLMTTPHERLVVSPDSELRVTVTIVAPHHIRVTVAGEIDLRNAADFGATLRQNLDLHQPATVDVAMAQVAYIDSTGIGVLAGAHAHARRTGGQLWVVTPSSMVKRVLGLVGLLEIVTR